MFNHTAKLAQILQEHQSSGRIWVAYSGGLDSRVLLQSLVQLKPHFPDVHFKAVHVNHGLSPYANDWAQHCQEVCQQYSLDCEIKKLDLLNRGSESLEEWARNLRYQLFAELLQLNEVILTAHTCDDQAETLLLQLLRGTGIKGLASMPKLKKLGKGFLLRPFLEIDRASLHSFALSEKLSWIEDESNSSLAFDRNYLRHKIFPVLTQRWPATKNLFARTAHHAAEADLLLEEIAAQDLSTIANISGQLVLTELKQLSHRRQKNLLRFWLKQQGISLPSKIKLQQIVQEVINSRKDSQAKVEWAGVAIRRFRDHLYALTSQAKTTPELVLHWNMNQPLELPNAQGLLVAQGIENLATPEVTVKFRQGGERFHPCGRVGSHPLKKLLQEWEVPPWQRNSLPLIFQENRLIAVPGYGVDHKYPGFSVLFLTEPATLGRLSISS